MSIPMPEKRTVTNYVRDPNSEGDYGLVTLWENQALTPSGRHWGVSGDGGNVSPDLSQSSMRLRLPQTFGRGGTSGAQLTRLSIHQTSSDEILVITGIGSKGSISTSPEIPWIYTNWDEISPPAKFPTSMVIRGATIDFRVRMRWFIYDESDALIGSLTGPTVFVEGNTEYTYKYDLDLSLLPDDIGKTARRTRATMWVYTSDGSPVPTSQVLTFYVGGLRIGVPHEIDFFDGNTEMDDPDFIVGWEGVELESKSIVYGEKSNFVVNFEPRSPFRSIKTSRMMDGDISSRVIYLGTVKADWDSEGSIYLFDAFFLIGSIMGDIPLSLSSTSMKVSFDKDMGVRTLNSGDLSLDLSPGDILDVLDGGRAYSPTGRSIGDTHTIHALSNSPVNYVVGPFEAGDSYYVRELTIIDGSLPSVMDIPPFYGDTEPFEYMGQIVYPRWDGEPNNSTSSFEYFEQLSPWKPETAWDDLNVRRFEAGVDRGMLYLDGEGFSWSGLVRVNKSQTSGKMESYYIDGVKFHVDVPRDEYDATIEAFTYPEEFEECIGSYEHEDAYGLFVHGQPSRPFSFAYRTMMGDALDGVGKDYKIHLVYNAYARESNNIMSTMEEVISPSIFAWEITTIPTHLDGVAPTSYYTIDSTKINPIALERLEQVLYGANGIPPRLPDIEDVIEYLSNV